MQRDACLGGRVSAMACLMVVLLLAPAGAIITGITLPGGFAVTEYYKGTVPNARSLALSGATPPAGYGPLVYIADSDDGKVLCMAAGISMYNVFLDETVLDACQIH